MSGKYYLSLRNIIVNDEDNEENTNVDVPVQAEIIKTKGPRIGGEQIPQAIEDEAIFVSAFQSDIMLESNPEIKYKISKLSSVKEENSVSNSDENSD